MKASELRLGNWVHDGSRFPMKVVGIFEDVVYLNFQGNEGDVWECKIDDLQPFEWNEEWLDKFGFERKNSSYKHKKIYQKDNFYVEYDFKGLFFYWPFYGGYRVFKIKYVHELQNFHYQLTGIEL